MTLNERLQGALTSAIRARDELRRETLRMAIAAAYNEQKAARRPLTDDEVIAVLARELKRRRESIEAFRAGGREDRAAREEAEAAVVAEFLPRPLSEEELREMVRAAIAETGASTPRDLGRVMGVLVPRTRGRAEGRTVSEMVARELAGSA
ncbi:MAG TPA: GatB/YqeY domain-containing protein [Candidatus Limnocylindrales bacterium]|nr:GatB/YqeY domain-containing protein [Candidatus Limnocylindrales bacterium]